MYSTIANGGVRIEPTLVRGTKGPDGRFTPAPAPEQSRVVSAETAKTLAQMLESVVDDQEGTGTKARIPGYRVGGKTGTSNRVDPATGRYKGYTASFAGFAPRTTPASPSTAPSRTPRRAATSAARSAAPSTRRSWSSRSRPSRWPHGNRARRAPRHLRRRSCARRAARPAAQSAARSVNPQPGRPARKA